MSYQPILNMSFRRRHQFPEIVNVKKRIPTLGFRILEEDGRRAEFILVYTKESHSVPRTKQKIRTFLQNLEQKGFIIDQTSDSDNANIIYVKLVLPRDSLLRYAQILSIELAFQTATHVNPPKTYFKFTTNALTAPSSSDSIAKRAKEDITSYIPRNITSAEKGLIIYKLLERTSFGAEKTNYGIAKLLHQNVFIAAYPMHDGTAEWSNEGELNDRQLLRRYWSNMWCWYKVQPIDLIHKYYGPEVAFYFAWLGFYNKMLLYASILGVVFLIIGIVSFPDNAQVHEVCNSDKILCPRCHEKFCKYELLKSACPNVKLIKIFDNPMTITFAAIMSLWATLFVEFWRRQQAIFQLRWNLRSIEMDLSMRPEFEETTTTTRISEITNMPELYVPRRILIARYTLSTFVVLLMIFIMIMAIIGVMIYVRTISVVIATNTKDDVVIDNVNLLATFSGSFISVVFMILFEMVYTKVAYWLTSVENPRTQIEFDNSYTYKTFAMEFVNCYAAVFYIAFFKARFYTYPGDEHLWHTFGGIQSDLCNASGCMNELGMQLIVIFFIKNLLSTAKQYIMPKIGLLYRRMRKVRTADDLRRAKPQHEADFALNDLDKYHLLDEYKQMVFQYGFVTFFVAAFPLAPLFALLNNIVEMRLDAYKLTRMYKRPIAFKVANLGAWNGILEAMTYISIATNAFVIAFTSEFIPRAIYLSTKKGGISGFSDYTLSEFNTSEFSHFQPVRNVSICHYPGYRYPPDHPQRYERNDDYWYLLAMQLLGVVVFEHLMVLINGFISYLVPDIPFSVKQQINYEKECIKEIRRKTLTAKYMSDHRYQAKDIFRDLKV